MRRALACLPLALLFIAIVTSNAQIVRYSPDVPTTAEPVTTPVPEITPIVSPVEGSEPGVVQYYDILRNTSFSCNIAKTGGQIYDWEKNNVSISKVPELKDRYKLEYSNATLHIRRTSENDAGNYTCKLGNEARHWVLKSRPYTKLPSTDLSVVEGQTLKLVCRVVGKPVVPVEWFYKKDAASYDDYNEHTNRGVKLENSTRIKLETNEAGVPNGQLVIEAIVREDAGAYACLPVVETLQRSPHTNAVTVLHVKVATVASIFGKNGACRGNELLKLYNIFSYFMFLLFLR